ncbi:MAG: hypothetical protein FJY17_01675 [Bacteroidetes bacterium]|nr:hypothetical protein [Bacteroidota bacterium]
MKTLIIHPEDKTTYFLRAIYAKLENYTLVTSGSKTDVNREISEHDKIFILGHGSPYGLYSVGQFNGEYVIDKNTVVLLRQKKCVFIWCNADKFVTKYNLNGLYSGMFVSEVVEAKLVGLPPVTQAIIDESNNLFAKALGEEIGMGFYQAYHKMLSVYKLLSTTNVVAKYNVERFYLAVNN